MATKKKTYLDDDVVTAARKRISMIFDDFEDIQVSISGGKDSTILYHLVLQEAEKRDRKFEVFFLDQEAEYQATIDIVRDQMIHRLVKPLWYQVPVYMTNSTSYSEYFLYAWGRGQKWMREKEDIAIKEIDEDYPERFYTIFPYLESKNTKKAYLVGLRADESITRYRAVTKNPGYKDLGWSTQSETGAYRFYPIYDFADTDIWTFAYDYNINYNKIYDLMYMKGYSIYKMRVSNLIHEKSYKCLVDLPYFDPETYDKLCDRLSGVSSAARYASEKLIFSNKKLPSHYKNWKQFRDFLLENIPQKEHRDRFSARFSRYPDDEKTYKKQVGQLLINDFENSKPIDKKSQEKIDQFKKKWSELL